MAAPYHLRFRAVALRAGFHSRPLMSFLPAVIDPRYRGQEVDIVWNIGSYVCCQSVESSRTNLVTIAHRHHCAVL